MDRKKAALHRGNDDSANDKAARAMSGPIVTQWERGTRWAGWLIGVSFGLMGFVGGVLGW